MSTITIVNYGLGNIFSVQNAIKKCGSKTIVTNNFKDIEKAKYLILPGVGAFENGMKGLIKYDLIKPILEYCNSGKPLLGICLGMQLLATISEEYGKHKGLNVIPGVVKQIPNQDTEGNFCKIPNIGWIELLKENNSWSNSILGNLKEFEEVYLVHSYSFSPKNKNNILANCLFNGHKICVVIKEGNIYGTQFHPEKSGKVGLKILKNFCSI